MTQPNAGTIKAICISTTKGVTKDPVPKAEILTNHGIEGDAHAGDWHRQVSLLADESIDKLRDKLPDLDEGAFAENLVTLGIDLPNLPIGAKLHIGPSVIMTITQIGKECHNSCAIKEATGDCVMPREGIFCRVDQGGPVQPGDSIHAEFERSVDEPFEQVRSRGDA